MIKFSKCLPGAMCEGCLSTDMPAARMVTVAGGEEYRNLAAVVNLCASCIHGLGQVSAIVCQQLQDETRRALEAKGAFDMSPQPLDPPPVQFCRCEAHGEFQDKYHGVCPVCEKPCANEMCYYKGANSHIS